MAPFERDDLGWPSSAVCHEHDQRADRPHSAATLSTSSSVSGRIFSPRTGRGARTFFAGFVATRPASTPKL